jgi:hypothetical protein
MIRENLILSGPYSPISAKGGRRRRNHRRMKSRRNKSNKNRTRRRYH